MGTPADTEIVDTILSIVGEDPKPSLLFGAPAVSLAQLEILLSLPKHTLDPGRITEIAKPVAESCSDQCRKPEARQLKRGDAFEEWLVFRPDPKGTKKPRSIIPRPAPPVTVPPPVSSPPLHETVVKNEGTTLQLQAGLPGASPVTPSDTPSGGDTTSAKSKGAEVLRSFFMGKKKSKINLTAALAAPIPAPAAGIGLPPPHRVTSKLWHDVPLVVEPTAPENTEPTIDAQLELKTSAESCGAKVNKPEMNGPYPAFSAPPVNMGDHSPLPRLPRPPARVPRPTGVLNSSNKLKVNHSDPANQEAKKAQMSSDIPLVAVSNQTTSGERAVNGENLEDKMDESHQSSDENSDEENNIPDSPRSPASTAPPTPFLTVALHDLPFSPGLSLIPISEWVRDRWHLLAAQLVALGAAVWILQYTGL